MSSAVSLSNHTFTGQAQSSKRLTSIVHILSPETDNCPSWISGRERMTADFFWIKTKICAIYIIVENISSNMRIEILCSLVANIVQNRVHMYMYFSGVFMYKRDMGDWNTYNVHQNLHYICSIIYRCSSMLYTCMQKLWLWAEIDMHKCLIFTYHIYIMNSIIGVIQEIVNFH